MRSGRQSNNGNFTIALTLLLPLDEMRNMWVQNNCTICSPACTHCTQFSLTFIFIFPTVNPRICKNLYSCELSGISWRHAIRYLQIPEMFTYSCKLSDVHRVAPWSLPKSLKSPLIPLLFIRIPSLPNACRAFSRMVAQLLNGHLTFCICLL